VSVRGKPILYHLFDSYPEAEFVIIGDYLYEQLEAYLSVNTPSVKYQLVRTDAKGTASGVDVAIKLIGPSAPFVLIWSDLIINSVPKFESVDCPIVVTTDAFTCRWTVGDDGQLHEEPKSLGGIPGIFYFPGAESLSSVPHSGEFVKWFANNIQKYELLKCNSLEELGDFPAIEAGNERSGFCRFFNKVEIDSINNLVTKTVLDPAYNEVHQNEKNWYKQVIELGFRRIPKIYSTEPLIMQNVLGLHAFNALDFNEREKRAVLADHLDALISLHDLDRRDASLDELKTVYLDKTIARVRSVAPLIPFFQRESVTVNGRKCRNVFVERHMHLLNDALAALKVDSFRPIHGDPTFSNTIVDDKLRVWFIDPRGSFATQGIHGDIWYDFAKVYYSAVGGYDAFNRRKFKLHIDAETVEVLMEPSIFVNTAKGIFEDYFGEELRRIKLLHGLIWLSLSGYARDDLDSVVGSFYIGLYRLEEGLSNI
jgi:aminoglycoside phosphotransferase